MQNKIRDFFIPLLLPINPHIETLKTFGQIILSYLPKLFVPILTPITLVVRVYTHYTTVSNDIKEKLVKLIAICGLGWIIKPCRKKICRRR